MGDSDEPVYQLHDRPAVYVLALLVDGDSVLSMSAQLIIPTPASISATTENLGTVLDRARSLAQQNH